MSQPVRIPLRNITGDIVEEALVDVEDEKRVRAFSWHLSHGYAVGGPGNIRLHRFIMNVSDSDIYIDHINNVKLDCRRNNLRTVTQAQNCQNVPKKPNTSSIYKGVSWAEKSQGWQVKCGAFHFGQYDSQEEAGWAYNLAALEIFGEHARLNDVKEPEGFIRWTAVKPVSECGAHISKRLSGKYQVQIKRLKIYKLFERLDEAIVFRDTTVEDAKKSAIKPEIVKNESGIAIIPVHPDNWALVDDEDYYELLQHKWRNVQGYVRSSTLNNAWSMHRFILKMGPNDKRIVDHINHQPHDNRRSNLRIVTGSQNAHNKSKKKGISSSIFIGVTKRKTKYEASMEKNRKTEYLGIYPTEEIAAWVRDMRSKELYGEFNLNGVPQPAGWIYEDQRGKFVPPQIVVSTAEEE